VAQERRAARFGLLLASLLLFGVMLALTANQPSQSLWVRLALSLTLVAGLYAGSGRRWVLLTGAALLIPAVVTSVLPTAGESDSQVLRVYFVRYATTAAFLLFASGSVFRTVLRERRVSADTILGGVCIYLLIGIAFVNLFVLVEVAAPGSIQVYGRPLIEVAGDAGHTDELTLMLYFSFTTLTTLGYGDIHPVQPLAQLAATAEAVLGQLYVAIFVARLVALHLAQTALHREDEE